MEQNKKNIEVVSGNGKNLDISPVSTHVPGSKPKIKDANKKIIIPNEKNTTSNEKP